MDRPKLKSCPFCGGKGEYRIGHWSVTAGCEMGHAISPDFCTTQEAADWWNRRIENENDVGTKGRHHGV